MQPMRQLRRRPDRGDAVQQHNRPHLRCRRREPLLRRGRQQPARLLQYGLPDRDVEKRIAALEAAVRQTNDSVGDALLTLEDRLKTLTQSLLP